MKRDLQPHELIERSIIKKFRKTIWNPFTLAVRQYQLIQPGDRIAVCISGGKDSMLMAKLMQLLQRYSEVPFEVVFLVMDPGYNEINRNKIESNAALLHIPITVFETDVFAVANNSEKNPCYLCARMRRGYLYSKAQELGCSKIALGHHFNDVIETTVMSMFYGSGQFTGQGWTNGTMTQMQYVPENQTDYIFSVAGEELGFLGCLLIIILLMALIIRLFYVAYRASTPFSALIAVGVGGMLLFQTFMNIFMNVGLLPVMGLTLPFFSYGGTSIVTMFAALGIAAGVRMREKPSWLQN